MKHLLLWLALAATAAAWVLPQPSAAANKETARVEEAIGVLNEISSIPEKTIPPWLLKDAYGVAIIPHVIKAGFIVGGRYGWGVLSVQRNGKWSAPIFVSLTGGSVGYQAGVQATDVVLVFKDSDSISKITTGKFTLGADASVAAGPVGRSASGGTEANLKSGVYSYSRSRGLFAGVALEGSVIEVDYDAGASFYGMPDVTPDMIFSGKDIKIPPVGEELRSTLMKIEK
jgi:lipid-binding SYLF domain-containing protein